MLVCSSKTIKMQRIAAMNDDRRRSWKGDKTMDRIYYTTRSYYLSIAYEYQVSVGTP